MVFLQMELLEIKLKKMRAYTGCKSENVCVARDNRSAKLDSVADIQTYLS